MLFSFKLTPEFDEFILTSLISSKFDKSILLEKLISSNPRFPLSLGPENFTFSTFTLEILATLVKFGNAKFYFGLKPERFNSKSVKDSIIHVIYLCFVLILKAIE